MKRLLFPLFLIAGTFTLPSHYKAYSVARSLPGRPHELGKPQVCNVDIAFSLHRIVIAKKEYFIQSKLMWDSTMAAYQCRDSTAISVGTPKSLAGKYMIILACRDSTVIYSAAAN